MLQYRHLLFNDFGEDKCVHRYIHSKLIYVAVFEQLLLLCKLSTAGCFSVVKQGYDIFS